MLSCLSGAGAITWLGLAAERLGEARERVNALNIFPVPDGDTGTNMLVTIRAALGEALMVPDAGAPIGQPSGPGLAPGLAAAADGGAARSPGLPPAGGLPPVLPVVPDGGAPVGLPSSPGAAALAPGSALGPGLAPVLAAAADGALTGAIGNSGTILSQFWSALARSAGQLPPGAAGFDGPALAAALGEAARAMRAAVAEPVEGTILTVADHVARKAARRGARDAGTVAAKACRDAVRALARTEDQLPVLAAAGVVDAGACGLVVVLAALAEAITGQRPGIGSWASEPTRERGRDRKPGLDPAFELVFLVRPGGAATRERLYGALGALGESITIAEAAQSASVHVHCDDPPAVLAAARGALGSGYDVEPQRTEPLARASSGS